MSARQTSKIDIDALLHPAGAFNHPMDVVRDCDLTLYEKRAILSSWASDSCAGAVESLPSLRQPNVATTVTFEDVMDALRHLDSEFGRRVYKGAHTGRRKRSGSGQAGDVSPT